MQELPDIKVLEKMTDLELAEYGIKKDVNGKLRNSKGQYIKGQTGRLNKPKKKITPKKELSDIIPAEIRKKFGDDPLKCLREMLKLAATKSEATRISKELLPYTHPKLASVEQKTFNFHAGNVVIEWDDEEVGIIEHEGSANPQDSLPGDSPAHEAGDDGSADKPEDSEDN